MTVLLDANVLVALVSPDHVHHEAAASWLAGHDDAVATCPITQLALVRVLMQLGVERPIAAAALDAVVANPRHEFWPDTVAVDATLLRGVHGHRQVTDAYLAALARAHDGTLATLDAGLAHTHPDVVTPIGRT
jgi:toxin-antitoxin system PIN domain toxin